MNRVFYEVIEMLILQGTKREITLKQWQEQLKKYMKRAADSMECFSRFHSSDDLTHLSEDCEKIIDLCEHTKQAIKYMEAQQ